MVTQERSSSDSRNLHVVYNEAYFISFLFNKCQAINLRLVQKIPGEQEMENDKVPC